MMRETLKTCGDLLTRENVMKQAANFQKVRIALLLPGINVSTSPTDFYPIQAVQMSRFKDDTWELFGDVLSAESAYVAAACRRHEKAVVAVGLFCCLRTFARPVQTHSIFLLLFYVQ